MPTTHDLFELLVSTLADAVAERVAARLARPASPTHYAATHLPPGCPSWRAARERARAMGVPLVRVGREVIIPADAWHDALARRHETTTSSTPRTVLVSDADAATMRRLGVIS